MDPNTLHTNQQGEPSNQKDSRGSVFGSSNQNDQPKISLPKGGGAIQGIGEKFQVNPVTGTGSLSIPIAISPGRSGFMPQLALSYDSGAGNSPFGLGWSIGLPSISRKTQKGLPEYRDQADNDTFLLSGAEDLVPVLNEQADGGWKKVRVEDPEEVSIADYTLYQDVRYIVHRYRPRIEGLFARIEKWTHPSNGSSFWKSITKENITTIYGQSDNAKIYHPEDEGLDKKRVFQWLIERSFDDRGNIIYYKYKKEDDKLIPPKRSEKNRTSYAQRYLKRVYYGNTKPYVSGGLPHKKPEWDDFDPENPGDNAWLFELVFDYGEHIIGEEISPEEAPTHQEQKGWPCRLDPFSNSRSGFDIRTYRLCRRILMFHHFTELGTEPYLVRSTDLEYGETSFATTLLSATHTSYRKGEKGYEKATFPPLEFEYTQAETQQAFPELPISVENITADHPIGTLLTQQQVQLLDFNGDGVTDLHLKSNGAWYLAESKGGGRFGALQVLPDVPSLALQGSAAGQLNDIDGDGELELTIWSEEIQGYHARTDAGDWRNFQPFSSQVNISLDNPNLRYIDVTGDGLPDLLITEQDELKYYRSEGKEGYAAAPKVAKALDETNGPRITFGNPARDIYLTDMSGDGLSDIVRIHNSSICYWANLGYGKFGPKIEMDNCPNFDTSEQFNPQYLKLVDIDGSGTTDIIYLGGESIRFWHNEAGNSWSEPVPVDIPLPIDSLTKVQVIDFLAKGTAQLVWSSPTPAHQESPLRYVDLMPEKPNLLKTIRNNLGTETHLTYQPSTDFYLADKAAGKAWITKLPFPVHVLTRQETMDHISGNSFVTRYAYHHGYYDRQEREFRGFGLVEQWDTEDYETFQKNTVFEVPASNRDEITDVPPVYTKTWFHTGAYIRRNKISNYYETEYYDKDPQAWLLDDTVLPPGLTTEEKREACRALKGSMLRQEVYAKDGPGLAEHPYTVTENSYDIQCLQPRDEGPYGVFLVTPRESLSYHYERNPRDPRIAHSFNLVTDRYGNSTHVASIVYPRRGTGHPEEQTRLYATLTESLLTHPDQHLHWFRHSLPVASRSYEVHGLQMPTDDDGKKLPFAFDDLRKALFADFKEADQDRIELYPEDPNQVLDYVDSPTDTHIQLRLLNRSLIQYATNDLDNPLGAGEEIQSLAIPYQTYTLAFTASILNQEELIIHQEGEDKCIITTDHLEEGGYLSGITPDPEVLWWIPSGKTLFFYPEEQPEDSETKAALAATRFYLPVGEKTPLGKANDTTSAAQESYVYYDQHEVGATDSYYLFVEKAKDPLENTMRVVDFDYRVLQARAMEDINNNRAEVAFDIHGMVIATAIRGKVNDNNVSTEGDELSAFQEVVCNSEDSYLQSIMESPANYLGNATTYFHYDLFAWQRDQAPTFALGLSREQHYRDLKNGAKLKIQKSIVYSDGFGREVLTKVPAEAGGAPKREEDGTLIKNDNDEVVYIDTGAEGYPHNRWVGNGRTLFNNKGKPVKQYEPFFDSGYGFTEEDELREWGVTPVIHYDPLTRVIRTDMPDGTFSRVAFSPWHQVSYDPIDTLTEESEWFHEKNSRTVDEALENRYSKYRSTQDQNRRFNRVINSVVNGDHLAAKKSLALANTPSWQFLDTLGRPFVAIAHNKIQPWLKDDKTPIECFIPTRTQLDIEGNPLFIFDGRRSGEIEIDWDSYAKSEAPEPPLSVIGYRGNQVMAYAYAMNGLQLYQNSMDAGESWGFVNVMGNPIHSWSYQTVDEQGDPEYIHTWPEYDDLLRPTHLWVERMNQQKKLVELLVYGEAHPNGLEHNMRGAPILSLDGAGLIQNKTFDFKGNLKVGSRYLAKDYESIEVDWQDLQVDELIIENPIDHLFFEPREFNTATIYDALNRVIETEAPDGSKTIYEFNEAGLLEKVHGKLPSLKGGKEKYDEHTFVENIDYDAKGQRERIRYGNQVITRYSYDPKTFRLERLWSFRDNGDSLQDIAYTYDAVGNITQIYDIAQPRIYTNNSRVEPKHAYTYDGLYQLIEAFGRESRSSQHPPGNKETIPAHLVPNIPISDTELRNYREYYTYDEAGNILDMQHCAGDSCGAGSWTREYTYEETSNRLLETTPAYCQATTTYTYDDHGNMTTMPHLHQMDWDYKDQLKRVSLVPECVDDLEEYGPGQRTVFFTYDTARQRVRKRYHVGNYIKERIYLGNYEGYRLNGVIDIDALQTLHISDDAQRICMVETTEDGERYYRYQLSNHLGSASMELNENAAILTYEEYHPYGTTALKARKSNLDISSKRYRYTGMERDEETGLNYHGARYYLSWLGRWGNCDIKRTNNLYEYASKNPIKRRDINGQEDFEVNQLPRLIDPYTPPLVDPKTQEEYFIPIVGQQGGNSTLENEVNQLPRLIDPYTPPLVDPKTQEEYFIPIVGQQGENSALENEPVSKALTTFSHSSDLPNLQKMGDLKPNNTSFHAYVPGTTTQPGFKGGGVGHPELDKLAPTYKYPAGHAAKISAILDESKGMESSVYNPSKSAAGNPDLQLKQMRQKAFNTAYRGGEVKVHGSPTLATEQAYQYKSIEASARRGAASATWLGRLGMLGTGLTIIGYLFSAIQYKKSSEEGYYQVGSVTYISDPERFKLYHAKAWNNYCMQLRDCLPDAPEID